MSEGSDAKSWFKDIFDQNYEYIRNYLFYLSGDIGLAEDLAQDVFLRVWEKREGLRKGTVRPYLFTIARNCFLKNRRRLKYDLKFRSTFFHHVENESPEYKLEMKEFDLRLQKTISSMPERCRTIFLMNRHDGMPYREIANHLQVSEKAVEKQMSKALAILRKNLGEKI